LIKLYKCSFKNKNISENFITTIKSKIFDEIGYEYDFVIKGDLNKEKRL
jgi:hypothetical protein